MQQLLDATHAYFTGRSCPQLSLCLCGLSLPLWSLLLHTHTCVVTQAHMTPTQLHSPLPHCTLYRCSPVPLYCRRLQKCDRTHTWRLQPMLKGLTPLPRNGNGHSPTHTAKARCNILATRHASKQQKRVIQDSAHHQVATLTAPLHPSSTCAPSTSIHSPHAGRHAHPGWNQWQGRSSTPNHRKTCAPSRPKTLSLSLRPMALLPSSPLFWALLHTP